MTRPRLVVWLTVAAVIAVGLGGALLSTSTADTTSSYITDEHGRALISHGFSTAGSAKGSASGLPDFTEEDLDREHADMGTNFVRFLISWRAVEPEPNIYDQKYLDGLEERVSWYAERGYHVMLDMHQDLWGVGVTSEGQQVGNGAPEWATHFDDHRIGNHDMWELYYFDPGVIRAFDNFWNTTGEHPELTDHYARAWQAVAERFADNETVVAYDVMNEPYGGTMQGPRFEAGPLTDLYQDVTTKIRDVDPDTWVCLEPQAAGYNWGTPTGLGKINDPRDGEPRIAYCPHLYPLPLDLGGGYEGSTEKLINRTVDAWRANTIRTAERLGDVPVILGEFGLDTNLPGALDYIRHVYSVMDEMGGGVAYWSRDNGSWGPYEDDGSTRRNLVPVLDRSYPRAVAGTPHSWTSADGRLELAVTPDASISEPTEFYLPASEFPDGADAQGAEVTGWDADTRILQVEISGEGKRTTVVLTAR